MTKLKTALIIALFLSVCAFIWIYVLNYAPPINL